MKFDPHNDYANGELRVSTLKCRYLVGIYFPRIQMLTSRGGVVSVGAVLKNI
jgi:hypothetical protein